MLHLVPSEVSGFAPMLAAQSSSQKSRLSMSDDWRDSGNDPNRWTSSSSSSSSSSNSNNAWNDDPWSTFASSEEEGLENASIKDSSSQDDPDLVDDSEAWLDALAAISAEEIEFNQKDNERADKARQMQEWGFDGDTIRNTFGVAVDDSRETVDEPEGLEQYRQDLSLEQDWLEEDADSIESHTRVATDADTGEPIRQQMVYVDEHACIGCTSCATLAESTFFMEPAFGRARVFQQWGDTDEAVGVAIESCPVDCIHYVPYDELVTLEIDRRSQRINNQARLVNQGESAHMASTGGGGFTYSQKISGNAKSRCSNCPTRGCKNCPMFGVGKNPEYERREKERLASLQRRKLERERAEASKSAEL